MIPVFSVRNIVQVFLLLISVSTFCQTVNNAPNWEKLDDAVVLVKRYDNDNNFIGHGSGFIINSSGTVITNYHVLKDAYYIKIETEAGVEFEMSKIIGISEEIDIAKFTIKNPKSILFPVLKICTSEPQKGIDTWAIGAPADTRLKGTISKGIISNKHYVGSVLMLQTDAGIAHGSSGGALMNGKGEVIGITSSGLDDDDGARAGINFAIYAGEIKKMQTVNLDRIIDESKIPGKLSFYTDWQYSAGVYLYIEGVYIGSFKKYFTSAKPECGDDGTVTIKLPSGTYRYSATEYGKNLTWNGVATIEAGKCHLVNIQGPKSVYIPPNTPQQTPSASSSNGLLSVVIGKKRHRNGAIYVGQSYLGTYRRNGKKFIDSRNYIYVGNSSIKYTLPPGTYYVTYQKGWRNITETVSIYSGQTTELPVFLSGRSTMHYVFWWGIGIGTWILIAANNKG